MENKDRAAYQVAPRPNETDWVQLGNQMGLSNWQVECVKSWWKSLAAPASASSTEHKDGQQGTSAPCPTCGINKKLNDERLRAYAEEVNGLLNRYDSWTQDPFKGYDHRKDTIRRFMEFKAHQGAELPRSGVQMFDLLCEFDTMLNRYAIEMEKTFKEHMATCNRPMLTLSEMFHEDRK